MNPAAPTTESHRSSPALYYAILFLVSLAMLSAQVTVTRLLSYKLFFHFVFLLISLAHLGIAGAATWIFASGWSTFSPAFFRRALYLMAVSLILFLGVYVWFAPGPSEGLMKIDGMKALPYLGSLSVLLIAFYFAAGCVLAGAFTQYKAQFNRLYAADLAGASLGCAVSLGMMALLGPVHTLLASAFLAVIAAALISVPRQEASQKIADGAILLAAAAVLVVAWFGTSWLERRVHARSGLRRQTVADRQRISLDPAGPRRPGRSELLRHRRRRRHPHRQSGMGLRGRIPGRPTEAARRHHRRRRRPAAQGGAGP